MIILYICNIEKKIGSGIFKKIIEQSKSFSKDNLVHLVYKHGNDIFVDIFKQGQNVSSNSKLNGFSNLKSIHSFAEKYIQNIQFDMIYFRNQFITLPFFKILNYAKKTNIKIVMEIPTYPYLREQLSVRRQIYKKTAFFIFDTISFKILSYFSDTIAVIRCNSKIKLSKKMIEIYNGFSTFDYKVRKKQNNYKKIINILGVGWIHDYHGFDRIIRGINNYYKSSYKDFDVYFHIVGNGNEVNKLLKMTETLNLENNVKFHGVLSSDQLNELYDSIDVSVGTLKLYKRYADIETSLKAVESIMHNIPFITSGKTPQFEESNNMIITVDNDDTAIDIECIVQHVLSIEDVKFINLKQKMEHLDWDNICSRILSEVFKREI